MEFEAECVVGLERFAEPVKRVGRDVGERPARRGAVGAGAELDNIAADLTPNLLFVMIAGGIQPRDADE